MLYLVEKFANDHWRTVTVGSDRDKALATFDRLCRDSSGQERLRVAVCVDKDAVGNKTIETLCEHQPFAGDAPELSPVWPEAVPLAPTPPAARLADTRLAGWAPVPLADPMPVPRSARRRSLRDVNYLRGFVYGGLAVSFAILFTSSLQYVAARMNNDGAAAPTVQARGPQMAAIPAATVTAPAPALAMTAPEAAASPAATALSEKEEPPVVPVATAAEPPAAEAVPVPALPAPAIPAMPMPAAGGQRVELVALVTDRATDGPVPAGVVTPPEATALEPEPEPAAPAPALSPVASPSPAPAPVPSHLQAHEACRTQALQRARFSGRPVEAAKYEWQQSSGHLEIKGRDVEFRNVFNDWLAVQYRCRFDVAAGTVTKIDVRLSK